MKNSDSILSALGNSDTKENQSLQILKLFFPNDAYRHRLEPPHRRLAVIPFERCEMATMVKEVTSENCPKALCAGPGWPKQASDSDTPSHEWPHWPATSGLCSQSACHCAVTVTVTATRTAAYCSARLGLGHISS